MPTVIVVGDGPGGLSAALFLAKNGSSVRLFGQDQTAMNYAYLHNYLGVPDTSGTDFQSLARRQVEDQGVSVDDALVASVIAGEDGVAATLESGDELSGDYLILSEGKNAPLAASLGLSIRDGAVEVNSEGLSSNPRVYVVGRSARPARSQAIISAGDGAKAALDILSRESGKDVQDWDTPPKD